MLSPSSQSTDLATLRKDIDAIDTEILDLLAKRLNIVHQVGHLKAKQTKQSFIRPAREATMIKNLVTYAKPHYHPEIIARIWRNIITASLYAEQPFHLAVEAHAAYMDNYWLGREYFGNFVPTFLHSDAQTVIHYIQNDPSFIGLVSPGGDWWQYLSRGTGAPYGIQVFACIPSVHIPHAARPSTALALAQVTPEETGDDISLISAHIRNASAEQELKQAFEKHKISIIYSQKKNDWLLLAVNRYIVGRDHPIFRAVEEMTASSVQQLLPMGCYGRQVDV